MQQPNSLRGPIRGSSGWWRGMPQEEAHTPAPPQETPRPPQGNIRWKLVERVRAEIAAGTYDTPEKWNAALERLLAKGWATAKWGETSTKRRARFYTITPSGRKHLGDAMSDYDRSALAIARVLGRA